MEASLASVSNHARGVRGCNHNPEVVSEPIQERYRMSSDSPESGVSFSEVVDKIGEYRDGNTDLTASRLSVEDLIDGLS